MKLSELIDILKKYNPEAETSVIVNNCPYDYTVVFGGGDGCTTQNASKVAFYVDKLCHSAELNIKIV